MSPQTTTALMSTLTPAKWAVINPGNDETVSRWESETEALIAAAELNAAWPNGNGPYEVLED